MFKKHLQWAHLLARCRCHTVVDREVTMLVYVSVHCKNEWLRDVRDYVTRRQVR